MTASLAGATVCQTCRASTAKSALKTTGRLPAEKAASHALVTPSAQLRSHVIRSMDSVNASKFAARVLYDRLSDISAVQDWIRRTAM